jgi:hypothetical protein
MRAVVFPSPTSLFLLFCFFFSFLPFLFFFFFSPQRLIYRDMARFHGDFRNFSLPYFGMTDGPVKWATA